MNHATLNVVRAATHPVVETGPKKAAASEASTLGASGEAASHVATRERVAEAVAQLNSAVKSSNRELQFQVDEESGKVIVRVRDAASGEVIRQMPSEEALRMARALQTQAGHAADMAARNLQGNAPMLVDLTV
jgi:flagellar protein FlaG